MLFVKFERIDDDVVWINIDHIIVIEQAADGCGSWIACIGHEVVVKDEVNKVLETIRKAQKYNE